MKKHFTGIALFIFIIGISALVASMFIEIPKMEVFEITQTVPRYESKKKCSKKYREYESADIKVAYAVYNKKTRKLFTTFASKREHYHFGEQVDLNFFVNNGNQTRFVKTEKVRWERLDWETDGNISKFKWLEEMDFHKNLYVIAECEGKSPEFDESRAMAVLIAKD